MTYLWVMEIRQVSNVNHLWISFHRELCKILQQSWKLSFHFLDVSVLILMKVAWYNCIYQVWHKLMHWVKKKNRKPRLEGNNEIKFVILYVSRHRKQPEKKKFSKKSWILQSLCDVFNNICNNVLKTNLITNYTFFHFTMTLEHKE